MNRNHSIIIRQGIIELSIFQFLYFFYVIQDMQASKQMLIVNANRSKVHYLLMGLTLYIIIFCLLNVGYLYKLDKLVIVLAAFACWIFLADRIIGVSIASSLVREAMVVLWVFIYLFFFEYGNKYYKNILYLRICVILMFAIFAIGMLYYSVSIYNTLGRYQVMNVVYNILALVPWMYLLFPDKWYRPFIIIVTVLTFVSLKRGAIVALIAMLFAELLMNEKRSAKKIISFFFAVIGIVIIYYVINNITKGFLASRFETESFLDGSGRSSQYQIAIKDLLSRNWMDLIIGKGSSYSISLLGTGIHNEWLEVVSSYGIIGLLHYISMFIFMAALGIKQKSVRLRRAAVQMIVLFFSISIFSTAYFGYISIQIFGFYGLLNSRIAQDRENY